MNALDNRAARNHVNRMCLAANVTLVESGSAGYLGQVQVIRKGETECYECKPKGGAKTYPGCTIRNTPSEPIHCIVWAKHLFNQLWGEGDPDEDVSPDSADPELQNKTTQNSEAAGSTSNGNAEGHSNPATQTNGNVQRTSTRTWAQSHKYEPEKLFTKLFADDIKYLLTMDKLWSKRRPPTPLNWQEIMSSEESKPASSSEGTIKDQVLWSLAECLRVLSQSTKALSETFYALKDGDHLVWDKDDQHAMDFVTACANVRAHVFGIGRKTRFDVKSMAGNIIPAIATTNAVVAGLLVLEAIKVLDGRSSECRMVFLTRAPNPRGRVMVPCRLDPPVPSCYVCSNKNEVCVSLNTSTFTLAALQEKVLKGAFNMVAPDVEVADGKGTILISSEEGETEANMPKTLASFNVCDGSRLTCDDFLQNYSLQLTIVHCEATDSGAEFEVAADAAELKKIQDSAKEEDKKAEEEDDDIEMVEEAQPSAVKRKPVDEEGAPPLKRARVDEGEEEGVICL